VKTYHKFSHINKNFWHKYIYLENLITLLILIENFHINLYFNEEFGMDELDSFKREYSFSSH
jgi:hypothetical protein